MQILPVNFTAAVRNSGEKAQTTNYSPVFNTGALLEDTFVKSQNKEKEEVSAIRQILQKTTESDIQEPVRKIFDEEIGKMQDEIIEIFVEANTASDGKTNYDAAKKSCLNLKDYAEQSSNHLNMAMNVPFQAVNEERVSIDEFSKRNPKSPQTELFQSTLFKMYELARLNRAEKTFRG